MSEEQVDQYEDSVAVVGTSLGQISSLPDLSAFEGIARQIDQLHDEADASNKDERVRLRDLG